ncbi:hypothetical protein ACLOJK_013658 [Asimina triloba]
MHCPSSRTSYQFFIGALLKDSTLVLEGGVMRTANLELAGMTCRGVDWSLSSARVPPKMVHLSRGEFASLVSFGLFFVCLYFFVKVRFLVSFRVKARLCLHTSLHNAFTDSVDLSTF